MVQDSNKVVPGGIVCPTRSSTFRFNDALKKPRALILSAVSLARCAKKLRTCRKSSTGEFTAPIAPETVEKLAMPKRPAASGHSVASDHRGSNFLFLYVLSSVGITSTRRTMLGARLRRTPVAVSGLEPADKTTSSRQNRAHASWSRITAISELSLCNRESDTLRMGRANLNSRISQAVSARYCR